MYIYTQKRKAAEMQSLFLSNALSAATGLAIGQALAVQPPKGYYQDYTVLQMYAFELLHYIHSPNHENVAFQGAQEAWLVGSLTFSLLQKMLPHTDLREHVKSGTFTKNKKIIKQFLAAKDFRDPSPSSLLRREGGPDINAATLAEKLYRFNMQTRFNEVSIMLPQAADLIAYTLRCMDHFTALLQYTEEKFFGGRINDKKDKCMWNAWGSYLETP